MRYFAFFRSVFSRFRRDQEGVITIEFAIYMPLLILWIAFSLLFFDAFRSKSQTFKVAFAISDIASRYDKVGNGDLDYLVAVQNKMLPPRLTARATRITSICYEDNQYKVLWSHASADASVGSYEPLTDATVPTNILPRMVDQESVILTEVRARWHPLTRIGGLPSIDWKNALVTSPRFLQIIPHEDLNPSTECPVIPIGALAG